MDIKKYWLIAWDNYYPERALENVRGTFLELEEAEFFLMNLKRNYEEEDYRGYDHYEIINVESYLGLTNHSHEFYIKDY